MGATDQASYPPPMIEVTIVRHGIRATASVEVLDGWVPDHDELGEVTAMAVVRLVRQTETTRQAGTPAPF